MVQENIIQLCCHQGSIVIIIQIFYINRIVTLYQVLGVLESNVCVFWNISSVYCVSLRRVTSLLHWMELTPMLCWTCTFPHLTSLPCHCTAKSSRGLSLTKSATGFSDFCLEMCKKHFICIDFYLFCFFICVEEWNNI